MPNEMIKKFLQHHPNECAREIENFSLHDILLFIQGLSQEEITQLISCLSPSIACLCLESLPQSMAIAITAQLPLFTLKTVLPRLQPSLRAKLENTLPAHQHKALTLSLRFSEQTAGAFLNTQVLFLSTDHTAGQALAFIKKFHEEVQAYIFCIDNEGLLQGMVTLQEIINTPASEKISHIMQNCPIVISAHSAIRSLLTLDVWEKQTTLPVVDEHQILLGVLEYSKIIPYVRNMLFDHRSESLVDSLTDIMFMFSHTTENLLNELNTLIAPNKGKH